MDRDELINAINNGPVRATMNDGSQFDVPSRDVSLVSDLSLHVLYRDDNQRWKTHLLSLVCMVRVEELEAAA